MSRLLDSPPNPTDEVALSQWLHNVLLAVENLENWIVTKVTTTKTLLFEQSGLILVQNTAAVPINLPSAKVVGKGFRYFFIKDTNNGFAATVTPESGETINGSATDASLNSQFKVLGIVSDGANWLIYNSGVAGAGAGTNVDVDDEGVNIVTGVGIINFVGAGVTVTQSPAGTARVNIPAGTIPLAPTTTVDATPTVAYALSLNDNTNYTFDARVIARRTDSVDSGSFQVAVQVRRESGGNATIIGDILQKQATRSDWDVTWSVSGASIQLIVTGAVGKTIKWQPQIETESIF